MRVSKKSKKTSAPREEEERRYAASQRSDDLFLLYYTLWLMICAVAKSYFHAFQNLQVLALKSGQKCWNLTIYIQALPQTLAR